MECTTCQSAIAADWSKGLCLKCSARAILVSAEAAVPSHVDDYEILESLSEGRMASVYRVRKVGSNPIEEVALKVVKEGSLQEIVALQRVKHTNIIEIKHVGQTRVFPYFTMPLLTGGTLRQRMQEFRKPEDAIRLLLTISRAVHVAQSHGVIHRDLKPENILFDKAGKVYVCDFGIAKIAGDNGAFPARSRIAGSPQYMAPEALVFDAAPWTGEDVYSLGVILYELLTGQLPTVADLTSARQSGHEVVRKFVVHEPTRPSKLAPGISRHLDEVCLRALQKEPVDRYEHAAGFAEDLERLTAKIRPNAAAEPFHRQWLRKLRRRPQLALAIVVGGVLFVALSLERYVTERAHEQHRLGELRGFASAYAGEMMAHFLDYSRIVTENAKNPQLLALLDQEPHVDEAVPELSKLALPFSTFFVTGVDGRQRARSTPRNWDYMKRSFAFRDYFKGARCLAEKLLDGAYLGRAFKSEEDGLLKYAISAPMYDSDRKWKGVVVVTIEADSAIAGARLNVFKHLGLNAALLGPRDRDRNESELPLAHAFTFLNHPNVTPTGEYGLGALSERLWENIDGASLPECERFKEQTVAPYIEDEYDDPVTKEHITQPAAFAPVGRTGYAVVVY